jgi:hypothetical protein
MRIRMTPARSPHRGAGAFEPRQRRGRLSSSSAIVVATPEGLGGEQLGARSVGTASGWGRWACRFWRPRQPMNSADEGKKDDGDHDRRQRWFYP